MCEFHAGAQVCDEGCDLAVFFEVCGDGLIEQGGDGEDGLCGIFEHGFAQGFDGLGVVGVIYGHGVFLLCEQGFDRVDLGECVEFFGWDAGCGRGDGGGGSDQDHLDVEGDETEVVGVKIFGEVDVVRDGAFLCGAGCGCCFDLQGNEFAIDFAPQVRAGAIDMVDFDAVGFEDVGGEEFALPPGVCSAALFQGPRSVDCFAWCAIPQDRVF